MVWQLYHIEPSLKHKMDALTFVWNRNWIDLNGYFIWWQLSALHDLVFDFFPEKFHLVPFCRLAIAYHSLSSAHMFNVHPDFVKWEKELIEFHLRVRSKNFSRKKKEIARQQKKKKMKWKWKMPFVDRSINASLESAWSTWIRRNFLCVAYTMYSSRYFLFYHA